MSLAAGSALAADDALLRNGFTIRHDHRELLPDGRTTRLYISSDNKNFVDVPTENIASFEAVPVEAAPPTVPVAAAKSETLGDIVRDASDKHLIDEDLINSVIRAESDSNPKAVSPKGAQGLMQLMPATARNLGVTNSFDSRANVEAGTRYLHEMLVKFDFDLAKALAAYNAGPNRVSQYKGVPPYNETRAYVIRIIKDFNRKKLAAASASASAARKAKKATVKAPPSKT
ncbi:MAG: Lytic transglycosylase, catalytic [Candidatus Angelobacter sp.]|jgi:soluble lytic murein transglycosylase-like protein|nr:Lytic transglycosylase, catalytic [Candidatus Angelobacter sp.]